MNRVLPVLLVLAMGCTSPMFAPEGGSSFVPPAIYQSWYEQMEECSGHQGDLARVQWDTLAGWSFRCPIGECAGWWMYPHSITLAADHVNRKSVVQHEMLHDILQHGRHGAAFDTCGVRL